MTTSMRPAANSGLHVRYEKAGLLFDVPPVPWNADAVVIEANVGLPPSAPREKLDFTVRLSNDAPPIHAELVRQVKKAPTRVFFRFPIPSQSCTAAVSWRETELGRIEIPMVTASAFAQGLALQMPSLHVNLQGHSVPCQTFVSVQCQSICAVALLTSAGPLAPVVDLGLHVELRDSFGLRLANVPIHFTHAQLRSRQALLSAFLPRLRRAGNYTIAWMLGQRPLQTEEVHVISKKKFLSSLRISATRFVLERANGEVSVVRWLPEQDGRLQQDGVARVTPCFFICSSRAGMAGVISCKVQAVTEDQAGAAAVAQDLLVTDGPMPLLGGTVPAADIAHVKHFILESSAGRLGILPLVAAPMADFTGEGGFAAQDDFLWSAAAEEQLNSRLGKLLDGE